MSKVLGGVSVDKRECLAALQVTDWTVHKVSRLVESFEQGAGWSVCRQESVWQLCRSLIGQSLR
jgi:hypothetical protein